MAGAGGARAGCGRPNGYEIKVKPHLEKIKAWARYGTTERSMFEALKVSHTSWDTYKKKYPELVAALSEGREDIVLQLKNALCKSALGYEYEEIRLYKKFDTESGEFIEHEDVIVKHAPPNVAAINLALKNFDRDSGGKAKWSNDWQNHEIKREELELKKKQAEMNSFVDGEQEGFHW